jgi:hypothetical protein
VRFTVTQPRPQRSADRYFEAGHSARDRAAFRKACIAVTRRAGRFCPCPLPAAVVLHFHQFGTYEGIVDFASSGCNLESISHVDPLRSAACYSQGRCAAFVARRAPKTSKDFRT